MTPWRMTFVLVGALGLQAVVFAVAHDDLLWLNTPTAVLEAAGAHTIRGRVNRVLDRDHLTRRHLETLATITARDELLPEHLRALRRLHRREPDDLSITLRLADALRRAGHYDDARILFEDVLRGADR